MSKIPAVKVKLTLIVKEFLNQEQANFKLEYDLSKQLLISHIKRNKKIFLITGNQNRDEIKLINFNLDEFENENSIGVTLYFYLSEKDFTIINSDKSFHASESFTKNAFVKGNNPRIDDFSFTIQGKANVTEEDNTFVNKIEIDENIISLVK